MTKISIVHFSPIELYPPVQNLLNLLAEDERGREILVITTANSHGLEAFALGSKKIKILRIGRSDQRMAVAARYWNYLHFHFASLLHLILHNPKRILYFETLSAFPVFLFKRFFAPFVEILIHYHEYTSVDEYRNGMTLMRWFHSLEKWLYGKAIWVSHTNDYRMEKFKADLLPLSLKNAYVIPNYPPRAWCREFEREHSFPLRIVYVGALSLSSMYTKQFAQWVMDNAGRVVWDIYSYNYTQDAINYLQELKSKWINLKAGVPYYELPGVLRNYDVGVILYMGIIPNHVYSASNKLFEYLTSGLDTWLPDGIKGSAAFVTVNTYPKVIAIDFNHLDEFEVVKAMNREGLKNKTPVFACEEVLQPLLDKLLR